MPHDLLWGERPIWLAVEPVDMRLGMDGLSSRIQNALGRGFHGKMQSMDITAELAKFNASPEMISHVEALFSGLKQERDSWHTERDSWYAERDLLHEKRPEQPKRYTSKTFISRN